MPQPEHRMTHAEERSDNIARLLAMCAKTRKTPSSIGFADFIINFCYKVFDCKKRTSREYMDVLISSWHTDRWQSRVDESPYLSDEEKIDYLVWARTRF